MDIENIVDYVNSKTDYERLEEVSTRQVAEKFGISTKEAYKILKKAATKKLITYLPPVNSNKFDCAGWIINMEH